MTDHVAGVAGPGLGSYVRQNVCAQILFAAASVGLADWLFYGHAVGWTLGAFGALSGAGIALLGETRFRALPSALLGVYFFGLCLRAVVDPDPLVVFLGLVSWVAFTL